MTASLTPNWLFSHTITIYHFEAGRHGTLATPVDSNDVVTGRFQRTSKVVLDREGREQTSQAVCFLPTGTTVNPDDEIEYGGNRYKIALIVEPGFTGGPAYLEVRLL